MVPGSEAAAGPGLASYCSLRPSHTLCRYNIGPMVRLEYELLSNFMVDKKGYDPAVRQKTFDSDCDFVCKVGTPSGHS